MRYSWSSCDKTKRLIIIYTEEIQSQPKSIETKEKLGKAKQREKDGKKEESEKRAKGHKAFPKPKENKKEAEKRTEKKKDFFSGC
uniref:Uncharacterized protein n=1 Tax=Noccaea caerulescens TaxID=107243 RepID=A0A1J3DE79_NOCCA